LVIVLKEPVRQEDIERIVEILHGVGAEAHISRGEYKTLIGVIGDREKVMQVPFEAYPFVEAVVPIMKPYKLVSREFAPEPTDIEVGSAAIGPETFTVIAGPCSVESEEQVLEAARAARKAGASLFRGGAYKPRTSPYAFQGLGLEGLRMLARAREETGLPVVTEVLDPRDVEQVAQHADVLQVGTRNMQNFLLLREVGSTNKPVLLKRGMSSTIEEWLMAAEYIAKEGNRDIILCERGIRTFETATRNTLDISAVPVVHALSHLPVLVDPSHATGRRDLVEPLVKAALAVGADGVMVEMHPRPSEALCDGPQSLTLEEFGEMMETLKGLCASFGRTLGRKANGEN
jgi:3-deoxy-7-phosphoheptulonate synthase